MKQRSGIYYSDAQKALMWDRWQKGESMNAIGRLFDRDHSSIQRILLEMGGLPPAPRKRSRLSLTLAEREEISRCVVAGQSLRSIAASLGRAASTISLARSTVTAVVEITGRVKLIRLPGIECIVRSNVN